MKTIEEQLWDYIDGNCTKSESAMIEEKIANNLQYHALYEEFMQVQATLKNMALDEPSMSFTRNVMDQVNVELKPVALKTKVDQRIIYAIMVFFIGAISMVFVYAIAQSDFTYSFQLPELKFNFNDLVNSQFFQVFIMVDVALILLCIDSYLRKVMSQKKGS
jgi:hypothetical protein